MKKLILVTFMFFTASTWACGDLPKKIDDNFLYAQVFSRSHMDLELAVVLKASSKFNVKILGGKGYDAKTLPDCNSDALADVDWLNNRMASQWVSGQSQRFTAAYRICFTKYHGETYREYDICNSEVGD